MGKLHVSKPGRAGDGIALPPSHTRNLPYTTLSRRELLAGSAALLPLVNVSCSATSGLATPAVLTQQERAVLDAFADRIVPPDEAGPGAAASGAGRYIERSLAEWNQAELPLLRDGLQALDAAARAQHARNFADLSPEPQDELMLAMEAGQIAGFTNAQAVFNRLHRLVLEGMFSDPYYGGNANYAGWNLIGYPGAVLGSTVEMQQMGGRLPPLRTSAYGAAYDGAAHTDGAQHDGH